MTLIRKRGSLESTPEERKMRLLMYIVTCLILFCGYACHQGELCLLCPPPPADSALGIFNPFWSKDGKKIFGLTGNPETPGTALYVVDSSGGIAQLLITDSLDKGSPVLSPDGTKIAHLAAESERLLCCAHVWVINSDGTNAHDLTPGHGNWDNVHWSPNSRYVIFVYDEKCR